ncbi:MAG: hypothetical protein WAT37_09515 [Saprospiraceae bacterium]
MPSKIIKFFTTIFLLILPFLEGIFIAKYSPYVEGKSMNDFICIWSIK